MQSFRSIASAVGLAVILTAGAFFYVGWYNWEFKRPPTAVYHNQYVSGDNATVTQNEPQKQKTFGLMVDRGLKNEDTRMGVIWLLR